MPPSRQSASKKTSTRPSTRPIPERTQRVRAGMRHMFAGRSTIGSQSSPPESPKTPQVVLNQSNWSSTRLAIPYISRTRTTPPSTAQNSAPASTANVQAQASSGPTAPERVRRQRAFHAISVLSGQTRSNNGRGFVDPADQHLAELAREGRRRRHKSTDISRRRTTKAKRKLRSKIVTCFVSGMV